MPNQFAIFARALFIKKTLGTRVAAGYLRNRGVPLEAAVNTLAVRNPIYA